MTKTKEKLEKEVRFYKRLSYALACFCNQFDGTMSPEEFTALAAAAVLNAGEKERIAKFMGGALDKNLTEDGK